MSWSSQDLSSQTRNGTHAHCSISMESYPLDHQESPWRGSLVPHWSEVKIAQSCLTLCDPMDYTVHDSPDQNTGVGRLSLLQFMKVKMKGKSISRVWLFATPWTAAPQAPPSMRFSRQEYWNGLPLPSPIKQTSDYIFDNNNSDKISLSGI